jgi:hypothetical protein
MTDDRGLADLAAALAIFNITDKPPSRSFSPRHTREEAAEHAEEFTSDAAAILAALDGWALVRVDDLGRQIVGLYMVERDEALATIAALRAALDGLVAAAENVAQPYRPAGTTAEDDWHALRLALAAARAVTEEVT